MQSNYSVFQKYVISLLLAIFLAYTAYAETTDRSIKAAPGDYLKEKKAALELTSFALKLQDYLSAGHPQMMMDNVNRRTFVIAQANAALRYLETIPKAGDERQQLYKQMVEMTRVVFQALPVQLKEFTVWDYLRYRTYNDRHFLLYRVETESEDFSFYELEVAKKDDAWQIIDWYNYSTDVWFTETMGAIVAFLYNAQHHPSADNTALGGFVTRRDKNVFIAFEKLTTKQKQTPIIQSALLSFAMQQDTAAFSKANEIILQHSKQNQFLLTKMSYFSEKGQYRQSLPYLERLAKVVGGDYQLELMRAEMLYAQGESKLADKALARAIKLNEDSDIVYYGALILLASYQQFEDAVLVLDVLQSDFDYVPAKEDLLEFDELKAFLNSGPYKRWMEKNAA